jgi:hypothetical protein
VTAEESEPGHHDPGHHDQGSGRPPWDEELARELVGSLVLVGVTRLNAAGEQIEQIQFYGRVASADPTRGIKLKLEGEREGQIYTLPPHAQAFQRAKPGHYRLRSTGEVVIDPDFTTSWTINEPAN